jgi:lipid-binding SYLF domain-containing protein
VLFLKDNPEKHYFHFDKPKKEDNMKKISFFSLAILGMIALMSSNSGASEVEDYSKTIKLYQESPHVQPYFEHAYGYAVLPTVGKAGLGVGGAYGKGQVYRNGRVTGKTSLTKLSVGFQAGGQAFSEIVFFEDDRAYREFTSGQFTFDAQATAVAITAGAQAKTGSAGTSASLVAGPKTGIQSKAKYYRGMAVFVYTKGGLMFEAAIGGQKFSFTPLEGF